MSQSPPKKYKRKMMLFANNGGVNSRTALLDGAPFKAQLTKSLVLNAGTGSPTYTRATTATFTDFEGVLRTAIAGEARFVGARRVRNLIAGSSENLTTAPWALIGTASRTATTVTTTNNGDGIQQGGIGASTPRKLVGSFLISGTQGNTINAFVLDATGTIYGSRQITLTPTPTRYSVVQSSNETSAGSYIQFRNDAVFGLGAATQAQTFTVTQIQVENVVGRTDQTTPSEYVSVGVLSSPWHGAGVDGVKYFSTFLNNTPISSSTAKYASLPGVAGSYFSTPDSSANEITSDIDIRVKAALTSWSSGVSQQLISKRNNATGASEAYAVTISSTGVVYFVHNNGSTQTIPVSTASVPFAAGTVGWVRVTWQQSTGYVNFYTSSDGVTWTQLGNANVVGPTNSLNAGTRAVAIGSNPNATETATGRIYQAQVYNGINGTLAVNFNANDYSTGTTWAASSTGETWTVNGGAYIWGTPSNAPFDANGPKGYLSEGSRQNICLQSEDFATTWAPVDANTAVTANAAVAPNGTTTADKIYENTTAAVIHYVGQTLTSSTSQYTYSVYLKAAERTWAVIQMVAGASNFYRTFNLSTGALGTLTDGASTSTVEALPNSWWRVTITGTFVAVNMAVRVWPTNGDNITGYVGTVNSGIYAWGAQVELGSFASTYIPTTTVAVTRNADVLTYPSAGNVSDTAGWMSCEYSVPAFYTGVNYRPLQADDGTENNRIQIAYDSSGTNQNFAVVVGGVAQAAITGTRSTASKSAGSYAANNFNAAFNGAAGTQDTSGTVPTVTTIRVGNNSASGEYLFGSIKNVRIGQSALSAAQVRGITT